MEQEWYLFCILMYWTRDCSMAISWYVFVQWLHKGFLYFHFPGPRGIFWVPSWAVLISRDVEEAGESVSMSMHCPLTVIPLHTSLQSMRAPDFSRQMNSYNESQREQKISTIRCSSDAGGPQGTGGLAQAFEGASQAMVSEWLSNVFILNIWMPPVCVHTSLLLIGLSLKCKWDGIITILQIKKNT